MPPASKSPVPETGLGGKTAHHNFEITTNQNRRQPGVTLDGAAFLVHGVRSCRRGDPVRDTVYIYACGPLQ